MVEETVTKPMSLMDIIPPLLPADTTPPPTHTPSSTRTLRPRPTRHATPERAPVSRKRVHTQRADMVQEQLLPRKRGKTGGVARRSGSAGADDDAYGVDGAVGARVNGVRRGARRTGDVVVKEEAMSSSVLFPTVEGGVSGGSGGNGLSPTRDVEAEVGVHGDDGVKVEVEREVKREVKEEGSEDEDGEDGEYYDDDEDDCRSGDTGEDSDGDAARVKTETKREVKGEVKREVRKNMGEGVEEGVSRGTVQLSATQSDTGVRTRRNLRVCATNPHGFRPATFARLQELSPEAREREVNMLLDKREWVAKRWSDPVAQEMARVRQKERYEKNKEKEKRRHKEWRDQNKEYVKQQRKDYREKNNEKLKQRKTEWREKNKEMLKQREKERYEKNKEKIQLQNKEYRKRNKEYLKQRRKECRERNKVYVKQRRKEYHEKNRDQINARRRERCARKKAEREVL